MNSAKFFSRLSSEIRRQIQISSAAQLRIHSNRLEKKLTTNSKRHSHVAATLTKFSEPLELVTVEDDSPKLRDREVQVAVDSAGVNTADVLMTRQLHHIQHKLPAVPGFELSGEVVQVGEKVKEFRIGDRVLGFRRNGTGAFAQHCVLNAEELFNIPYSMKYEEAASLPLAYGSAFLAYSQVTKLEEGSYVLVVSSNGSTGLAAIDLAQNHFRCKVIAATESEAKCAVVRPLGVLATVEYPDENLPKTVRKATGGRGVDVVIDTVGGKWFDLALKCLKHGGHLCSLGFSSGQVPTVSIQELIRNRITLTGVWLGGYAEENPDGFRKIIETIIKYRDKKYISPHSATCYPMDKVNDALFSPEARDTLGKVVLKVNEREPKPE